MSTHYVATLRITRVEKTPEVVGDYKRPDKSGTRKVITIANMAISGVDLEDLRRMTTAHLAIVQDGGEIDL